MVIPYQTAKFKSANIFAMVILGPTAKLIPANISGNTVYSLQEIELTRAACFLPLKENIFWNEVLN